MNEPLLIFSRTFDLLAWLLPKSERFPRIYRHTLTQRINDAALDLQEHLSVAQSARGERRARHLLVASGKLDVLRVYLRLAHAWLWFNDGQYEHVSRIVAEIGRLLGGWINQTNTQLAQEKKGHSGP